MNAIDNSIVNKPPSSLNRWRVCAFFALLISGFSIIPFDLTIAQILDADRISGDFRKFLELSEFFAHGMGIAFILVAVLAFRPDVRFRLPRVITALAVTSLIVHAIKFSVVRIRPGQFDELLANGGSSWLSLLSWADAEGKFQINSGYVAQSFPSGHSAAVVALAVGLCWLIGRGKWFFVLLATLGCVQRILFHAHWPSDVLIGAAIGFATSEFICRSRLSDKIFRRLENRSISVRIDESGESKRVA